jgi:hypothetical protein
MWSYICLAEVIKVGCEAGAIPHSLSASSTLKIATAMNAETLKKLSTHIRHIGIVTRALNASFLANLAKLRCCQAAVHEARSPLLGITQNSRFEIYRLSYPEDTNIG